MTVDDGGRDVHELPVRRTGLGAQHVERGRLVDRVALHEDSLGALGDGSAPERAFEVVVFREPAQHDVDRALPVRRLAVGDVREDAPLRGLLDERRVGRVEQGDHRARCLVDDLLDQTERVLRALAEPDERDVRTLLRGHGADELDVDLTRDHLVPERGDDLRNELQAILALVRDQYPQMFGLAVAHSPS